MTGGTAVVTGASRGIGREVARRLASKWEIVAVARSAGELDVLRREIEEAGGDCSTIELDVTDPVAVQHALQGIDADVLVNNAGIGVLRPLLDLTVDALSKNPTLDGIGAYVTDSGEGRWTVMEGIELGVPLPVISGSLDARFRSQDTEPFANKLISMMRHEFGGHAVQTAEKK